MRVWIDQDLCTGDGLCNDHCPTIFRLADDGISYVCDPASGEMLTDPGGCTCTVEVPTKFQQAVVDAATVCPGECIFIEESPTPATYSRSADVPS